MFMLFTVLMGGHLYRMKSGHKITVFIEANKDNHDGCWVWGGALDSYGHPLTEWLGKNTTVRSLVRRLLNIELPVGTRWVSRCKNKLCANPRHSEPVPLKPKRVIGVVGTHGKDVVANDDMEHKFWKKVLKGGPEQCWLWDGAQTARGYGFMWCEREGVKRTVPAHRISYAIRHGKTPGDKMVCHRCDAPLCVNPDHLFLGSAFDNVSDCIAKGRDRISQSKLTQGQVDEIREALRLNPSENRSRLARKYGVSRYTIIHILSGKTWKTRRPV